MIDSSKINKKISSKEFLNSISKMNNKEYTFENIAINGQESLMKIENQVFKNIIFKNCSFKYLHILGCKIIDCQFIDCRFFDTSLCDNVIMNAKVSSIQFSNNTHIERNIFDAVEGNLDNKQHYISNINNYFKNMDFSGFLPAYTNTNYSDCDICCNQNYFYNTKVSVEAIERLSERAKKLWKKENNTHQGLWRSIIEREGTNYENQLEVMELLAPGQFLIDLRNMDSIEKLNLVASVLTNHFNGSFFRVYKGDILSEDSIHSLYSTPNPLPARIVDSRGYYLKDGVIKNLNIKVNYDPKYDNDFYDFYDGINLGTCLDENNLQNPDNYECKALIKRMK